MKKRDTLSVVDTNVMVWANGRSNNFYKCVLKCIAVLKEIRKRGRVAIDDCNLILDEYRRVLHQSGQPGVGDSFFKWLFDNQAVVEICERVTITPNEENPNEIIEFPNHPKLIDFDPSDRKFVAVSAVHPDHPRIHQALDSKWWGYKDTFLECGIVVEFICPDEIQQLYKQKVE